MPSPLLWIVATPIGNIDDLSPRARSVLAGADLIMAEDTRRAGLLLSRLGIRPARLLSFFEHNEAERQEEALAALASGESVALMTDAGTPLLADPGYRLVRKCRELGIQVRPVPGPSAPVAALSAAGIAPIPFTFLGFLPRAEAARRDLFASFASVPGSLVFFERRNRLKESLAIAHEALGEREFAICRELTKVHEEFIYGILPGDEAAVDGLLGEITVIIGPPVKSARLDEPSVEKLLLAALARGLKPKEAAREVRKLASGWKVSELYELIQELRQT